MRLARRVVADGVRARRDRRRQEDDERADATSRRVSAFASACRADAERRAEKSRGLAAITHRSRAAVSRPVAFCRGTWITFVKEGLNSAELAK